MQAPAVSGRASGEEAGGTSAASTHAIDASASLPPPAEEQKRTNSRGLRGRVMGAGERESDGSR